MGVKTKEELEIIKEVKSRFSKLISLDSNSKLQYVNDSALKALNKEIGFTIEVKETILESEEHIELTKLLGLKLLELKGRYTSIKILGMIEEVDGGVHIFFEILEKNESMKYISNIQHFLLKRETWYKAIAYSLPDLIFIYDDNGTYLDVIARYENWSDILTGSALKLIGANIRDILGEEQSDEFLSKIHEVLRTKETIKFEYSLDLEYEKGIKHYSALISPVKGDNAVIWVAREITELYNTRMQIKEAMEYYELSHKIKSSVISNLNHEVRTPLNIIMNTIEYLKKTNEDKGTLDQIRIIEKSSKHLLDLFENMVLLSDQNVNDMKLMPEDYNFYKMIGSIVTYINELALEKGLKLLVDISPDVPISVTGDRGKINEIINHLISNSIKFTESGSILLKIDLEIENYHTFLKIIVEDTGVGISYEDQKKMFKSFEKGQSNVYSSSNGLGIGLTLVKKIIELMDGEIKCISELYKGTKFEVKIPIVVDTDAKNYYASKIDKLENRILILDSHVESRKITEAILDTFKFETKILSSIDSAMEYISDVDNPRIDTLILDDNCISSYAKAASICTKLRRLGVEKIIILTNMFNQNVLEIYQNGIIDDYLVKPITHESIYNIVVLEHIINRQDNIINEKKEYINYKALVADDNFINREVAVSLLKSLGMKVDKAKDGNEAYEKSKANKYDLIFMDLEMPIIDGFEALVLIREISDYQSIPIIAMSASSYDEVKDGLSSYKFTDYAQKPMELHFMSKLLDKYLDRSVIRYKISNNAKCELTDMELMKIPYLNYERVLERVCGDKKLILKMLDDFSKDLKGLLKRLSSSIIEKDTDNVLSIIHRLKGTCGNLAFDIIYEEIVRIELDVISSEYSLKTFEKLNYMLNKITEFNYKVDGLEESINKNISSDDKDVNKFNSLLLELDDSLAYGRVKEIKDLVEILNSYRDIFIKSDILDLLKQRVMRYRFKEAKKIIEELINIRKL